MDPEPLRKIVKRAIHRENIDKAFEKGTTKGIAVSTTEVLSGKTCWFQEGEDALPWDFMRSVSMVEPIQQIHVEASCTAPVLFPPVKIGKHYHVDGAMSVKAPLNPLVNMGATRILAVASEKPLPFHLPVHVPKGWKPRLYHLYKVIDNMIRYNYAIEQAGTVKFINYFSEKQKKHQLSKENVSQRHIFTNEGIYPENYRTTDVFLFYPSRRIKQSTVYPIGDELGGSKKTHFLFERKFTEELITLGYEDARKRHEKLDQFFNPPPSRSYVSRFFTRKKDKSEPD